MKFTILQGSFRSLGNTESLLGTMQEEIEKTRHTYERFDLRNLHIEACTACWTCQNVFDGPGCPKKDDAGKIFDSILSSDAIILATPIYSWYCTPPMKKILDRLVYVMNKYYGDQPGPCLWSGKMIGILTTCGYDLDFGAGVFEEGIKRYAKHSNLLFKGMYGMQDDDDRSIYQSEDVKVALASFIDSFSLSFVEDKSIG